MVGERKKFQLIPKIKDFLLGGEETLEFRRNVATVRSASQDVKKFEDQLLDVAQADKKLNEFERRLSGVGDGITKENSLKLDQATNQKAESKKALFELKVEEMKLAGLDKEIKKIESDMNKFDKWVQKNPNQARRLVENANSNLKEGEDPKTIRDVILAKGSQSTQSERVEKLEDLLAQRDKILDKDKYNSIEKSALQTNRVKLDVIKTSDRETEYKIQYNKQPFYKKDTVTFENPKDSNDKREFTLKENSSRALILRDESGSIRFFKKTVNSYELKDSKTGEIMAYKPDFLATRDLKDGTKKGEVQHKSVTAEEFNKISELRNNKTNKDVTIKRENFNYQKNKDAALKEVASSGKEISKEVKKQIKNEVKQNKTRINDANQDIDKAREEITGRKQNFFQKKMDQIAAKVNKVTGKEIFNTDFISKYENAKEKIEEQKKVVDSKVDKAGKTLQSIANKVGADIGEKNATDSIDAIKNTIDKKQQKIEEYHSKHKFRDSITKIAQVAGVAGAVSAMIGSGGAAGAGIAAGVGASAALAIGATVESSGVKDKVSKTFDKIKTDSSDLGKQGLGVAAKGAVVVSTGFKYLANKGIDVINKLNEKITGDKDSKLINENRKFEETSIKDALSKNTGLNEKANELLNPQRTEQEKASEKLGNLSRLSEENEIGIIRKKESIAPKTALTIDIANAVTNPKQTAIDVKDAIVDKAKSAVSTAKEAVLHPVKTYQDRSASKKEEKQSDLKEVLHLVGQKFTGATVQEADKASGKPGVGGDSKPPKGRSK